MVSQHRCQDSGDVTAMCLVSWMLTSVNGRDKVICVNGLEVNQIENKVKLLLNSSGAKLKPLKNLTLEAAPGGEAARGIWSVVHDQSKPGGGYTI